MLSSGIIKTMNWDIGDCNPLADLEKFIEETENETGIKSTLAPIMPTWYQDAQQLYLLGWSSRQIIAYLKEIKDALND